MPSGVRIEANLLVFEDETYFGFRMYVDIKSKARDNSDSVRNSLGLKLLLPFNV
jgi:hypothetical protein